MTEKTIWICDGCDAELVVKGSRTSDWKAVLVVLNGFTGYPTCAPSDPVMINAHLCPKCSTRYYETAHPRLWPRLSAEPSP